jgi:UPF0755 protein
MKKLLRLVLLAAAVLLVLAAWLLLGSATAFEEKQKFLYIHTTNPTKEKVQEALLEQNILKGTSVFNLLAGWTGYYDHIKPGKYKVEKGTSVIRLLRILQKGRQEEVRMVIGKVRLPEEMAQRLARYIETDSAAALAYLTNDDSLASLGVDQANWMTAMLPNTYNIYWTYPVGQVMRKLKQESDKWWSKEQRKEKAAKLGYTPQQIFTIASIVEEETNMTKDKPLIASVYLNRLKKGMPLQADPTVRFARKDFESNRVTYEHLRSPSPYNTYLNKGLPPGPICIPSLVSIDAVLNAPATDYLYFVAKPDFSGYSVFTANFNEHKIAAKRYQDSLNAYLARKAAQSSR